MQQLANPEPKGKILSAGASTCNAFIKLVLKEGIRNVFRVLLQTMAGLRRLVGELARHRGILLDPLLRLPGALTKAVKLLLSIKPVRLIVAAVASLLCISLHCQRKGGASIQLSSSLSVLCGLVKLRGSLSLQLGVNNSSNAVSQSDVGRSDDIRINCPQDLKEHIVRFLETQASLDPAEQPAFQLSPPRRSTPGLTPPPPPPPPSTLPAVTTTAAAAASFPTVTAISDVAANCNHSSNHDLLPAVTFSPADAERMLELDEDTICCCPVLSISPTDPLLGTPPVVHLRFAAKGTAAADAVMPYIEALLPATPPLAHSPSGKAPESAEGGDSEGGVEPPLDSEALLGGCFLDCVAGYQVAEGAVDDQGCVHHPRGEGACAGGDAGATVHRQRAASDPPAHPMSAPNDSARLLAAALGPFWTYDDLETELQHRDTTAALMAAAGTYRPSPAPRTVSATATATATHTESSSSLAVRGGFSHPASQIAGAYDNRLSGIAGAGGAIALAQGDVGAASAGSRAGRGPLHRNPDSILGLRHMGLEGWGASARDWESVHVGAE